MTLYSTVCSFIFKDFIHTFGKSNPSLDTQSSLEFLIFLISYISIQPPLLFLSRCLQFLISISYLSCLFHCKVLYHRCNSPLSVSFSPISFSVTRIVTVTLPSRSLHTTTSVLHSLPREPCNESPDRLWRMCVLTCKD